YGSFSNYIWKFVNDRPLQHSIEDYRKAPAIRPESEAMSKDLKRKGFKFMGPTVAYAFMQATGLVNDHEKSCFRYAEVKELTI
ncbi:MAG: DNA-3-methyladenine glycosylase I, partial [Leeuwenhoekiella sp.]